MGKEKFDKSKNRKRIIISVVIIILLLCSIAVAFIVTSVQGSKDNDMGNYNTSFSNGVFESDTTKIEITSVTTDNSYSFINKNQQLEVKKTENKFVFVTLNISNKTEKKLNLKLGDFKIKYLKNKNDPNLGINTEIEYNKKAILDVSLNDIQSFSKFEIQPELIKTICIIFEVPNTNFTESYQLLNKTLFIVGSSNYAYKFQI